MGFISALAGIISAISSKLWQDAQNKWQNDIATDIQNILTSLSELYTTLTSISELILAEVRTLPTTTAQNNAQGSIALAQGEWDNWHKHKGEAQKVYDSLFSNAGALISAASDNDAQLQYTVVPDMASLLALTKFTFDKAGLGKADQIKTFTYFKHYFTDVLGNGGGSLPSRRKQLTDFVQTLKGYLTPAPGFGTTDLREAHWGADNVNYSKVVETISVVNGRYQVNDECVDAWHDELEFGQDAQGNQTVDEFTYATPKPWPSNTLTSLPTKVGHDDFVTYLRDPNTFLYVPISKEYNDQHNMNLHYFLWNEVVNHAQSHSDALNRILDVVDYTNAQIAQLDSLIDLATKGLAASNTLITP